MESSDESAVAELTRSVAAVLAVAHALPSAAALQGELECVAAAVARGYFLPDEDERVRHRFNSYVSLRAVLLETLAELAPAAGRGRADWQQRLPVFVTAFAAACLLVRANRFVIDLAGDEPVVWKKLDEADAAAGIPRKTFTRLYRAAARPRNLRAFLGAADFYFARRGEITALAADVRLRPVVALLADLEPTMERRRRDALKRLVSYRWFSFLRRHRSAWRQVMFGIFEVSGRAIAELHQPGVKPAGAPKRITPAMRDELAARLQPGDVFVTRHDDAVSNWFLPGYWPHTALYLGTAAECAVFGVELPTSGACDGRWFLEAKKDGVLVRSMEETLQVDACQVLRPPVTGEALATALKRALSHAGKPYDFLFDFRTADCLACSEVVYRGFHGVGPVRFRLAEVGGRLCLSTEAFIQQALACGFEIVATAGLDGSGVQFRNPN